MFNVNIEFDEILYQDSTARTFKICTLPKEHLEFESFIERTSDILNDISYIYTFVIIKYKV